MRASGKLYMYNQNTLFQPPDILDCTLSRHIGKSKGLRCCGGFDAYDPRFATCCQGGNLKTAVVHRNKEEKMHAYVKCTIILETFILALVRMKAFMICSFQIHLQHEEVHVYVHEIVKIFSSASRSDQLFSRRWNSGCKCCFIQKITRQHVT